MQDMIIVNASNLLKDDDVAITVPALQMQMDRDFLPAWGYAVKPIKFHFATAKEIPQLPPSAWPIFLNRHSKEQGALGWHDDDSSGKIYSRVFVGDCIRFGVDWRVTNSHEALEMALDPNIRRVWHMPNGERAALEACDPVEADTLGYDVLGVRVSDFILPAYFSAHGSGPFDFRKVLTGPCPTLAEGGYQSVTKNGVWTQVFADLRDGIPGTRALMNGHRRMMRGRAVSANIEVFA